MHAQIVLVPLDRSRLDYKTELAIVLYNTSMTNQLKSNVSVIKLKENLFLKITILFNSECP